jgi:protein kinase N
MDKSKKPPRTVHIDVYCTGSEDVESSSSSSSFNIEEVTTQAATTVIEGEDMLLRHRKVVSRRELPRKLAKEKVEILENNDDENLFDFSRMLAAQGGNDKEEVYESKKMLFKKYLGDQRQIQKFNELKTMMNLRRQISDDVISSNYPNSSRSTIRDFTSSSLASAVANSPSTVITEDNGDWRELDLAIQNGNFITSPTQFQINERSEDKSYERIKEFKRLWNRSNEEPENDLLKQHKLMENFLFTNNNFDYLGRFDYQKLNEMENISDSSPSTVISLSRKRSEKISAEKSPMRNMKPINVINVVIPEQNSDYSPLSTIKSAGTNYSKDHYELATKFGSVIKTMRKPGHHVGPVRNPSCLCETCKRWVLERDQNQPRERAYSFGETPITRTNFWRKNNRYYV